MARPLVHNAADPQQVKEARKQERLANDQASRDWRELLALPAFQRRAWALLEQCHENQTSFDSDALVMARREGERTIGLWFKDQITKADPMGYVKLLTVDAKEKADAATRPQPAEADAPETEPDAEG